MEIEFIKKCPYVGIAIQLAVSLGRITLLCQDIELNIQNEVKKYLSEKVNNYFQKSLIRYFV